MPRTRILVADDQSDVVETPRLLLRPLGFEVQVASSPAGILAAAEMKGGLV